MHGDQETQSKRGLIIVGLEGVLEIHIEGEINEPKNAQDNRSKNFRVGCCNMRGVASARARRPNALCHHGSTGPVPDGGSKR
jgi:hypothetical protein